MENNVSWFKVKLGDLCSVITKGTTPRGGYLSKNDRDSVLFLRAENINDTIVGKDNFKYISKTVHEKELKRSMLKKDDILLTIAGTLGRVAIMPEKFLPANANQAVGIIRVFSNKCDLKYLYYYLKNPFLMLPMIAASSGQSVQPNFNLNQISNIEIKLHTLSIQRKITAVLSSIDDKIELNNKVIANLESQLSNSFKFEYFENESRYKWETVEFGNIVSKFATGLNPRKNFVLGHGDNYYVTIKNMGNNQIYLDDKCDKVDDEALSKINVRSNLESGDFLFSGIGTIGRVFYIDEKPANWNISESVFTIRPNNRVSKEFMYLLLLSRDLQDYVNQYAQGSAQKGIRMSDFKKYKVSLPPKQWIDNISSRWGVLIQQTKLLYKENQKLMELRDALIPKLMSGEIDVSKVEI